MSTTPHAKLSPSSSERWLNCPASAGYSDDSTSAAAELGTLVHQTAADIALTVKDWGTVDISDTVDRHWSTTPVMEGVSEDDWSRAHTGVEMYLREVQANYRPGDVVLFECRVTTPRREVYGTADCVILRPNRKRLTVIDYKNGRVDVESQFNSQTAIYAIGAATTFPEYVTPKTRVETVIVQPNSGGVKRHTSKLVELNWWFDTVVSPAVDAAEIGTKYLPGTWCKWCPASGLCRAQMESAVASDFGGPGTMTPGELAAALLEADRLEEWCKAVREKAFEVARHDRLPGWHLAPGRGRRTITDESGLVKAAAGMGLKKDDLYTRRIKGVTELDRLIGKSTVTDFCTLTPGALTLKPGEPHDDAREDFGDV